jgi:hypothetical protein
MLNLRRRSFFADITEQKEKEKKDKKFIINVKVYSTAIEEKTCESV